ncbi:MAG: hypothetical protein BAJATHORv1_100070 [Candidatus Thorarchaeota archaeon]|nr:MAG: hypothetical protein BAJATHORv1_100070 [Candidatus Thorarchaeota archaeon]
MIDLVKTSEVMFREAITSIELTDLTRDGKKELVITTMNGDLRVFHLGSGTQEEVKEVCKTGGLPPVAAVGFGDILDNGIDELVVGTLDNMLQVIAFDGKELASKASTPLGTIPTAICVTNVMGEGGAEVIVSTNDRAIRCYGWFHSCLDKLAHKVVERPTFSMAPLRSRGLAYSRFVFGDEMGYLYVYQYADDRLHEIAKSKVGGELMLVATGNINSDRNYEIATVSDGNTLTLFGIGKNELEAIAKYKTKSPITSLLFSHFYGEPEDIQLLLSLGDSTIHILEFKDNELVLNGKIKTMKKSIESMIAVGDIDGNGNREIVQAVGNNLSIIRPKF